jgi:choline dehydrogenase
MNQAPATAARELGPFDYVIVGGGTAGCVLANRLSADRDVRVLLLEAGPKDDWIWIHIPVGYLYCIGNPRTDWCYRTEPDPGLNGRSILYARGRVLGGCSSINAMLYLRGQRRDYDEWAQLTGDADWSWARVFPIFKATEDHYAGASDIHGAGGEWRVEEQRLSWQILDAFADAAAENGIPKVADFNGGDNTGVSRFQVNQRRGVRWNATKAFLRPALQRPNLTVMTGALVQRVRFEGKRAVGVELIVDGAGAFARARRETILAAGAIGSPQLLQLSGVGDPTLLAQHGIAPVHALAGVGENLQDHLQLRMAFKVKNVKTLNQTANSLVGKAMMGLQYLFNRSGPLSMAPSQLGAFAKSDPSQATANIEYHVQPLSLDKFGEPLHPFPAFTASVCNLRPQSRGYVRIKSADPRAHPAIAPNYLSSTSRSQSGRAIAARHATHRGAPALARFAPEEFLPGPQFADGRRTRAARRDIATTIFHPVGT